MGRLPPAAPDSWRLEGSGTETSNAQEGYPGLLVVGGGIAGVTAALEAAESGAEVYLVEKEPYLGGRVVRLARYFPKLCPPACGMEINFRRLKDNPRVHVLTMTEVEAISGQPGRYDVRLRRRPRFVTERCTACGECVAACPAVRPDASNYGMSKTRAIYLGGELAHPLRYAIDEEYCLGESCRRCEQACPYGAIDLVMQPETLALQVGAVIWATGWRPYDARAITNLAFGRYRNVVTNVMLERMAAADGPTAGHIVRPSDGRPARRVAFIQCAGSRERLHLGYCSGVCCLASLKEATYVLDQDPEAEVFVFYIDLRTPGTYEAFAQGVLVRMGMHAVKGKVADILCDEQSEDLTVIADDMVAGRMARTEVDLVVLATGMVPSLQDGAPSGVVLEEFGFALSEEAKGGIFAAGCARAPVDVATATLDATAAAMAALGVLEKSRSAAR